MPTPSFLISTESTPKEASVFRAAELNAKPGVKILTELIVQEENILVDHISLNEKVHELAPPKQLGVLH